MTGPKVLTRNLQQQEPGRGCHHATAVDASNIADPLAWRQTHETSDAYARALARLSDRWRVVACKDELQWIVQRRKEGGAERPWRAAAYFGNRDLLIRFCATYVWPGWPRRDDNLGRAPGSDREYSMMRLQILYLLRLHGLTEAQAQAFATLIWGMGQ